MVRVDGEGLARADAEQPCVERGRAGQDRRAGCTSATVSGSGSDVAPAAVRGEGVHGVPGLAEHVPQVLGVATPPG